MTTQPIPRVPLCLGLAGLLPFWGLALWLAAGKLWPGHGAIGEGEGAVALAAYAALIVSFLGGVRWGLAVHAPASSDASRLSGAFHFSSAFHYGVSVAPSLVAWALLALPEPWRLAGLGLFALVLGPIDRHLVAEGLAPPWFGRLRLILSGGAGVALLLAAAFV